MDTNQSFGEDLVENKAVQTGGATIAATGMASIGINTIGLGAITAGKAGLILASVAASAPIALAVGGVLINGGLIVTIANRRKKCKWLLFVPFLKSK